MMKGEVTFTAAGLFNIDNTLIHSVSYTHIIVVIYKFMWSNRKVIFAPICCVLLWEHYDFIIIIHLMVLIELCGRGKTKPAISLFNRSFMKKFNRNKVQRVFIFLVLNILLVRPTRS